MIPLRILINPLNSWITLLPMGHLFTTTSVAIKKRMSNPTARDDVLSHWLNASRKNPDKLSLRKPMSMLERAQNQFLVPISPSPLMLG